MTFGINWYKTSISLGLVKYRDRTICDECSYNETNHCYPKGWGLIKDGKLLCRIDIALAYQKDLKDY